MNNSDHILTKWHAIYIHYVHLHQLFGESLIYTSMKSELGTKNAKKVPM